MSRASAPRTQSNPVSGREAADPLDRLLSLHPELAAALQRPCTEEGSAALDQLADLLKERSRSAYGDRSSPPPTDALPGTPEMSERLRERVEAKQGLHAREDPRFEDEDARGDLSLGILPPEVEVNGAAAWQCLEGRSILAKRAMATTGKRVGSEREIRALLDERRRVAREERRLERTNPHGDIMLTEWSLLLPAGFSGPIAGRHYSLQVPHRLIVQANTKGEARAAFKQALAIRAGLPSGLSRSGKLMRGRGTEPVIEVEPSVGKATQRAKRAEKKAARRVKRAVGKSERKVG